MVLCLAACTDVEPTETTLVTTTTSVPIEATTTTALAPPVIDLGVDLESGVLRLAVVGDLTDDLWAGHFAYWNSVNDDLGGVGGRFQVELVTVGSIRDAMAAGALAVSVDVGDDARVVLELLAAGDASVSGRLADLTAFPIGPQVVAGLASLATPLGGDLGWTGEEAILVTHPNTNCSDVDPALTRNPVGAIEAREEPALFVLCVPAETVLATAAEALRASPGSMLLVPGSVWSPELAAQLAGTTVLVSGYLPAPGTRGRPGGRRHGIGVGGWALVSQTWSRGTWRRCRCTWCWTRRWRTAT